VTTPATASAPVAPHTPAATAALSSDGEQLLAEPPVNWQQVFRSDRPGTRLVEYVPDDSPAESPERGWTEKLAFESFTGDPLPAPRDLIAQIAADQKATCEHFTSTETFAGEENGYPTVVQLLVCFVDKLTNKGQVSLLKAIRGDANFYVVTLAARTSPMELDNELPLPKEIIAQWSAYLGAIRVCHTDMAAHPCPTTETRTSEVVGG
jgi:hypothetical protein